MSERYVPLRTVPACLIERVVTRCEFFPLKKCLTVDLIESFFGKMARTLLRGIRVESKEELKTRIEMYLREGNEEPVVFRCKYKLGTLSVVETH
jgi:hypothetical protein